MFLQVLRLVKQLYLSHMSGAKRLMGLKPHTLHCLQLLYVSRRRGVWCSSGSLLRALCTN